MFQSNFGQKSSVSKDRSRVKEDKGSVEFLNLVRVTEYPRDSSKTQIESHKKSSITVTRRSYPYYWALRGSTRCREEKDEIMLVETLKLRSVFT